MRVTEQTMLEIVNPEAPVEQQMNFYDMFNAEYNKSVNSLPTYFRALAELRKAGTTIKPKYLRLPATEELFEINLNSRDITIPKDFKSYGIGVEGDHLAEVLYFSVDRYFDTADLAPNDKTNYTINWRNTGDGSQGRSSAYAVDILSDKVIFGWIISDKMTNKAGNIKFSLTITHIDEKGTTNDLVLSTKEATCAIQAGIAINEDESLDEDNAILDVVATRPLYAGMISSSETPAPAITTDLPKFVKYVVDAEGQPTTDAKVTLTAKAVEEGENTGELSYYWYAKQEDSGWQTITGENTNSYTIPKAGSYMAKVGSTNDNGTNYSTSNIVYVPGPTVPAVANGKSDLPQYSYILSTGDVTELPTSVTIVVDAKSLMASYKTGEAANQENSISGYLRFQWFDTNGSSIENKAEDNADYKTSPWLDGKSSVMNAADSYLTNTFKPASDCTVYCLITHCLNGEEKSYKTDTFTFRHYPHTPTNVTISAAPTGNTLTATAVPTSQFYTYQWYEKTGGIINGATGSTYTATGAAGEKYEFSCTVKEVMYAADKVMRCESDTINSNILTHVIR